MTRPESGHVVDGVLFFHEDGTASWDSGTVAAVAPVEIVVGGGCVATVDPANPRALLSWTLAADGDVDALAAALGDPGIARVIERARAAGIDERVLASPWLVEAWSRYAAVAAARRWIMHPLDEGALLIDRAVAAFRVGRELEAAALFVAGEDHLIDLGERCRDGEMPTTVVDLVREALDAARECGADLRIEELAAELDGYSAIGDEDLAVLMDDWRRAIAMVSDAGAAAHLGGGVVSLDEFIDITLVPPRIIAWRGASEPDLTVEYDGRSATCVVRASLAAEVDPYCLEVRQLLIFAAGRDDGALVATAPMRLEHRSLVAVLPAMGVDPADLVFGVVSADTDPASLRVESVGRHLAEIDRTMIEIWGRNRAALARLRAVAVDAGEAQLTRARDDYRTSIFAVRNSVDSVLDDLEQRLETVEIDARSTDDRAFLIRARIEAVARYRVAVDDDRGVDPVLAELLPPEVAS
ncbi:hypothetical protein [Nocardia salmonicida]|uniref:hypothetical protein n=1 Tax=Nocardia salmonicida TaxID=53431 RepID=UPI00340FDF88